MRVTMAVCIAINAVLLPVVWVATAVGRLNIGQGVGFTMTTAGCLVASYMMWKILGEMD